MSTRTQFAAYNMEVVVNKHAAQTTTSELNSPSTSKKLLWQILQSQQQLQHSHSLPSTEAKKLYDTVRRVQRLKNTHSHNIPDDVVAGNTLTMTCIQLQPDLYVMMMTLQRKSTSSRTQTQH